MRKRTHAAKKSPAHRHPRARDDQAPTPRARLDVAVSRGMDHELEWYFVYAETALRHGNVQFAPSHVGALLVASQATEEAVQAKARELAQTVEKSLRALPDHHSSVLRAVYTPRRWPRNVEATFHPVTPLAVRLAMRKDPWPARTAKQGLEEAAASRLSARLATRKASEMARLKANAVRVFGAAVVAYTKVRVLGAPSPSGGS
jgi:hypothetical protein